jgi:hypothetical protein
VFVLPSQRSSRYLLPLMPALAMLMGLHVQSVSTTASMAVAILSWLMLSVLVWLGWHAGSLGLMPGVGFGCLGACLVAVTALCICIPRAVKAHAWLGLLSASLALTGLNILLQGLSGERTAFQGNATQRPMSQTVWVPEGFNGEFERFQFLLPGQNTFVPDQAKVDALSAGTSPAPGAWFIVARTPGSPDLPCEAQQLCDRVAVRWDIEQRLKPGQVNAGNIARPAEWLWRQEWLLRLR